MKKLRRSVTAEFLLYICCTIVFGRVQCALSSSSEPYCWGQPLINQAPIKIQSQLQPTISQFTDNQQCNTGRKTPTQACLAGYDGEIFELMQELRKETRGTDIQVHFYLFSRCKFILLGSLMSDLKTLHNILRNYHHYFCLNQNYMGNYDVNDHWCMNKLVVIPGFCTDLNLKYLLNGQTLGMDSYEMQKQVEGIGSIVHDGEINVQATEAVCDDYATTNYESNLRWSNNGFQLNHPREEIIFPPYFTDIKFIVNGGYETENMKNNFGTIDIKNGENKNKNEQTIKIYVDENKNDKSANIGNQWAQICNYYNGKSKNKQQINEGIYESTEIRQMNPYVYQSPYINTNVYSMEHQNVYTTPVCSNSYNKVCSQRKNLWLKKYIYPEQTCQNIEDGSKYITVPNIPEVKEELKIPCDVKIIFDKGIKADNVIYLKSVNDKPTICSETTNEKTGNNDNFIQDSDSQSLNKLYKLQSFTNDYVTIYSNTQNQKLPVKPVYYALNTNFQNPFISKASVKTDENTHSSFISTSNLGQKSESNTKKIVCSNDYVNSIPVEYMRDINRNIIKPNVPVYQGQYSEEIIYIPEQKAQKINNVAAKFTNVEYIDNPPEIYRPPKVLPSAVSVAYSSYVPETNINVYSSQYSNVNYAKQDKYSYNSKYNTDIPNISNKYVVGPVYGTILPYNIIPNTGQPKFNTVADYAPYVYIPQGFGTNATNIPSAKIRQLNYATIMPYDTFQKKNWPVYDTVISNFKSQSKTKPQYATTLLYSPFQMKRKDNGQLKYLTNEDKLTYDIITSNKLKNPSKETQYETMLSYYDPSQRKNQSNFGKFLKYMSNKEELPNYETVTSNVPKNIGPTYNTVSYEEEIPKYETVTSNKPKNIGPKYDAMLQIPDKVVPTYETVTTNTQNKVDFLQYVPYNYETIQAKTWPNFDIVTTNIQQKKNLQPLFLPHDLSKEKQPRFGTILEYITPSENEKLMFDTVISNKLNIPIQNIIKPQSTGSLREFETKISNETPEGKVKPHETIVNYATDNYLNRKEMPLQYTTEINSMAHQDITQPNYESVMSNIPKYKTTYKYDKLKTPSVHVFPDMPQQKPINTETLWKPKNVPNYMTVISNLASQKNIKTDYETLISNLKPLNYVQPTYGKTVKYYDTMETMPNYDAVTDKLRQYYTIPKYYTATSNHGKIYQHQPQYKTILSYITKTNGEITNATVLQNKSPNYDTVQSNFQTKYPLQPKQYISYLKPKTPEYYNVVSNKPTPIKLWPNYQIPETNKLYQKISEPKFETTISGIVKKKMPQYMSLISNIKTPNIVSSPYMYNVPTSNPIIYDTYISKVTSDGKQSVAVLAKPQKTEFNTIISNKQPTYTKNRPNGPIHYDTITSNIHKARPVYANYVIKPWNQYISPKEYTITAKVPAQKRIWPTNVEYIPEKRQEKPKYIPELQKKTTSPPVYGEYITNIPNKKYVRPVSDTVMSNIQTKSNVKTEDNNIYYIPMESNVRPQFDSVISNKFKPNIPLQYDDIISNTEKQKMPYYNTLISEQPPQKTKYDAIVSNNQGQNTLLEKHDRYVTQNIRQQTPLPIYDSFVSNNQKNVLNSPEYIMYIPNQLKNKLSTYNWTEKLRPQYDIVTSGGYKNPSKNILAPKPVPYDIFTSNIQSQRQRPLNPIYKILDVKMTNQKAKPIYYDTLISNKRKEIPVYNTLITNIPSDKPEYDTVTSGIPYQTTALPQYDNYISNWPGVKARKPIYNLHVPDQQKNVLPQHDEVISNMPTQKDYNTLISNVKKKPIDGVYLTENKTPMAYITGEYKDADKILKPISKYDEYYSNINKNDKFKPAVNSANLTDKYLIKYPQYTEPTVTGSYVTSPKYLYKQYYDKYIPNVPTQKAQYANTAKMYQNVLYSMSPIKTTENIMYSNTKLRPETNYYQDLSLPQDAGTFHPLANILRNTIQNYIKTQDTPKHVLFNGNKEIIIPLGDTGFAKYITDDDKYHSNSFVIKTDHPDVHLKAWHTKMKIVKAKLVFETEDRNVTSFVPIVKDPNKHDPLAIQNIATNIVSKYYGEPIVIKDVNSQSKYAMVLNPDANTLKKDHYYFVWPTLVI